jgi:hypothetical protein
VRITVSNRDRPPLHASLQCGHGAASSCGRFWSEPHGSLQPALRRSSGQWNRISSQRRQPRREASSSCRGVGRAAGFSRAPPLHRSVPIPNALPNEYHVAGPDSPNRPAERCSRAYRTALPRHRETLFPIRSGWGRLARKRTRTRLGRSDADRVIRAREQTGRGGARPIGVLPLSRCGASDGVGTRAVVS